MKQQRNDKTAAAVSRLGLPLSVLAVATIPLVELILNSGEPFGSVALVSEVREYLTK